MQIVRGGALMALLVASTVFLPSCPRDTATGVSLDTTPTTIDTVVSDRRAELLPPPNCGDPGAPVFLNHIVDGEGGVAGMQTPCAVAIAADGTTLYVAGCTSDSISVLRRDPENGKVTHAQTLWDGLDGFDNLHEPTDLWVTPDGAHLFVGSWEGLSVFAIDQATGELSAGPEIPLDCPNEDACIHAERPHGSAAGDLVVAWLHGNVLVLKRDPVVGSLTVLAALWQDELSELLGYPVDTPGDVRISPDGEHLYVYNWNKLDIVAVHSANGTLEKVGEYPGEGQPLPEIGRLLAFRPDGKQLFGFSDFGPILVFGRQDDGTLELQPELWPGQSEPGQQPTVYDVVPSPDSAMLYVTMNYPLDGSTGGGTILAYPLQFQAGPLANHIVFSDEDLGKPGRSFQNWSWDGRIAVSDSHDWLALTHSNWPAYEVVTLALSEAGTPADSTIVAHGDGGSSGLQRVRFIGQAPGENLTAISAADRTITVYLPPDQNGALVPVQSLVGGDDGDQPFQTISEAAIMPDGSQLYLFEASDEYCLVSRYSASEGQWALAQAGNKIESPGGCPFFRAQDMVFSADGHSLYVVPWEDSAIYSFERNQETGDLTFSSAYQHEPGESVSSLALSPDGAHVYCGGMLETKMMPDDPLLKAFERLPGGGLLPLLDAVALPEAYEWVDSEHSSVQHLAVSPDGRSLFASVWSFWQTEAPQNFLFKRSVESGALYDGAELDLSEFLPNDVKLGAAVFSSDEHAMFVLVENGIVRVSVDFSHEPPFVATGLLQGGKSGVPSLPRAWSVDRNSIALTADDKFAVLASFDTSSLLVLAADSCP